MYKEGVLVLIKIVNRMVTVHQDVLNVRIITIWCRVYVRNLLQK